ncbi:MAG: hypothetical protein LUD78_11190 [Clostridiales bacterium]|nr:hypothetical protein [Clostridiales bacterium]
MKEFVCEEALPSDEQPFHTKYCLNYAYFLLYLTNLAYKPIIPIDLIGK